MNKWNDILTADEIKAYHALAARLDPRHARLDREWWESRTLNQLDTIERGAWQANLADQYQLARSYAALAA